MKKLKFTLVLIGAILMAAVVDGQSIEDGKRFLYYDKYISAKNVFQNLVNANPANEEAVYWLGQSLLAPDEDKDCMPASFARRKTTGEYQRSATGASVC